MAEYVNTRPKENVWDYPRPPALEKTALRLRVLWTGKNGVETVLADSTEGYRVLETSHPPTYYIPPKDVNTALLSKTARQSFCEWKGVASYYDLLAPGSATKVPNRIWSYDKPTNTGTDFAPIEGFLSFYASANLRSREEGWRCMVEGEEVIAQEGDFYGGWKTAEHEGKMKGGAGTWGW